jgi:hypothetical protein
LTVSPWEFAANDGSVISRNINNLTTTGGTPLWAAVRLPNTAIIDSLNAYTRDTSATNDLRIDLQYCAGSCPGYGILASVASANAPGLGFHTALLSAGINNENGMYWVVVTPTAGSWTNLGLLSVHIEYHLP